MWTLVPDDDPDESSLDFPVFSLDRHDLTGVASAPIIHGMTEEPHSPPPAIQRNDDGGYGPVDGAPSEPEATALVAMAYDDALARQWLLEDQAPDGSLALRAGSVTRDQTALGALALDPGPARERALDHLVTHRGYNGDDPNVHAFGWPWTVGTHGWTEPTAWGLLAVRTLRSSATDRIADALAFFQERECAGGGWNYGSSITLGVDLPPYVQTTAMALLGLGDLAPDLAARGTATLERLWPSESAGLLSLAITACALRLHGSPESPAVASALRNAVPHGGVDTVTAAWVAFGLGASGPWDTA